jgi:hypothetical protein
LKATSERKITANRANARASTGPKTAQGRTRSARNALRHALSLPVHSDKGLSEEVEALAREIAGADASTEMQRRARRVAEAPRALRAPSTSVSGRAWGGYRPWTGMNGGRSRDANLQFAPSIWHERTRLLAADLIRPEGKRQRVR